VKEMRFKIGDRVKVIREHPDDEDLNVLGATGVIIGKYRTKTTSEPLLTVKFDDNSRGTRCYYRNELGEIVLSEQGVNNIVPENLELIAKSAEIDNTPKIKLDKKEEVKEMGTGILKRFVGFFTDDELVRAAKMADEIAEQGYHKAKLLVVKDGFSFNYGFKKNTLKRVTIRRAQKMVTL
jgi:hypothetical protein